MERERITQAREARGWSRAELARRANMNPSTISLIESGRQTPYPSQTAKIAAALGVGPEARDVEGEEVSSNVK